MNFTTKTIGRFGQVPALRLTELEPGMRLIFTGSYGDSEVIAIEPSTNGRSTLYVKNVHNDEQSNWTYPNRTTFGITTATVAIWKRREETPVECPECSSEDCDLSKTPGVLFVCMECGAMVMSETVPFVYEDGSQTVGGIK